jgi:flagellar motor switch protein FliM
MSVTSSSPSTRRQRVRDVDFRRPSKFSRDQVRMLERAHEGFCRSVSSRLSAELRAEVQLDLIGSDQLPYSVVMVEESPRDALVGVLTLDPQGTQVALIVEMGLAHSFVTRLLGGEEPPPRTQETLTELEIAVAGCAVGALVETLSATWSDLADVKLELAGMETSPMGVELVPPSEPTLLMNMSATIGGQISIITLCIPHRSVASFLGTFDRSHFGFQADESLPPGTMQRAVGEVDVLLRAEVGAVDLPLEDVLRLGPGDIVRLGRRAEDGAVLHVDEVPVYTVAPGRNRNARAVQVTASIADGT